MPQLTRSSLFALSFAFLGACGGVAASGDGTSGTDDALRHHHYDMAMPSSDGATGTTTEPSSNGSEVSTTFAPLSLSGSVLPNPERGVADWAGMDMVSGFDLGSVKSSMSSTGRRMFFCPVDLQSYVSSDIPSSFLATLGTNLGQMRSAGAKCEMIIAYGVWSGSGNDATAAQIVKHAAQLSSVLHSYADVIPIAKAGFIGAYGQWFGSKNGNSCGYASPSSCPNTSVANNRKTIRDAILSAYASSTQIGFPYPGDIHAWYPTPLSASEAFDGSDQARVSMEQDCPLSSGGGNLDSGSFLDNQGTGASQQTLISYVQSLSEYATYFGEVSDSCTPQITDCSSALSYFATYHGSTFKMISNDAANYINAWKSGGCWNQIQNQLGYRFQLDEVAHQGTVAAGESITVKVQMRNVGWSRLFSARPLVAKACMGSTCFEGASTNDLRSLPDQASSSTEVDVVIPFPAGANKGAYAVQLSIPDIDAASSSERAFAIQFANTTSGSQSWNDSAGYLVTGTNVTVQ